jgi:hypothetical protein
MKLSVDLSALHRAVAPLGQINTDFSIVSMSNDLESVAIGLSEGKILGKDIQIDEIKGTHGILNYDGHQVMLYIPDQGPNIEAVLKNGKRKEAKRVHVAECKTIIGMRNRGLFNNRYDVISRIDGWFPIFGKSFNSNNSTTGNVELAVCQNCLSELNFQGFSDLNYVEKSKLTEQFSYIAFFETYSSYFKSLPISTVDNQGGGYTADWSSISSNLRSELNYTCEQCGVNLKANLKLLHTHHINGNKSDNNRNNLRVLCVDCHKKQPHHGHLYVSNKDTLKVNQLRREQNKFNVFNYDDLRYCVDSALDGLVMKCQSMQLPGGELGIVIHVDGRYIPIDLCWPRRKVAVLINGENGRELITQGWNVFTAFEALSMFEQFQKMIR